MKQWKTTKATITALIITAAISATSNAATYRTAIVLTNGTEEIIPDSVMNRMSFTTGPDGKHSMNVERLNRSTLSFNTDSITEINYGRMSSYEHFAGDWYLVASPVGEPNAVGIMVSGTVSIPVHAVLPHPDSSDYGKYIYCHTDSMPHRKGLKYAADFKLHYQSTDNGQSGSISIVLDDQNPISTVPYGGDASTYAYLDDGVTQYFGDATQHDGGDNGGRHMFLVSENISTHELEGMELEASWTAGDNDNPTFQYLFPQNYHIFWIVSYDVPFVSSEHDAVGYIDIFSSSRIMRQPWSQQAKN